MCLAPFQMQRPIVSNSQNVAPRLTRIRADRGVYVIAKKRHSIFSNHVPENSKMCMHAGLLTCYASVVGLPLASGGGLPSVDDFLLISFETLPRSSRDFFPFSSFGVFLSVERVRLND